MATRFTGRMRFRYEYAIRDIHYYLSDGTVQIIEPHDKGISQSIRRNLEPRPLNIDSLDNSPLLRKYDYSAYFEYIGSLSASRYLAYSCPLHCLSIVSYGRSLNARSPLKFVNTSMHGVSDAKISKAFQLFGLSPYIPVAAQQKPDPEFPTVKFPNPEEKGMLEQLSL